MRPQTSSAPTAQEIAAGRLKAAQSLFHLFGGTDAAGKNYDGVLHQNRISALETEPKWKDYLDGVRNDPHSKTLAVVSASRNDPNFPPTLVAELFSDEERDQDPRWFGEVFLTGAAQIHAATGRGLLLPQNHPSLDLVRSAFNLIDCLSEEERSGLGLFMPENAPKRELATTLSGILAEAARVADEPGLTAAQRFFRWAVRKWEQREDAADKWRRQRASTEKERGGNPASILPPPPPGDGTALPAPPQAAADHALPPVPRGKPNGAAALEAPALPAPPVTAAPAAPPPATATPAAQVNEGQAAVIEAIRSSGLEGKAFVSLFTKGTRSYGQLLAFAESKGLI